MAVLGGYGSLGQMNKGEAGGLYRRCDRSHDETLAWAVGEVFLAIR